MKHKQNELDVDFIGGQEPLTKEEEKAISDYIKAYKTKTEHNTSTSRKKRITKREKSVA